MASEILTPALVWEDFKIEHSPEPELIAEYKNDGVTVTRFTLRGRSVKGGDVKIYCALARDESLEKSPGVFVVQDFADGADETFITFLARKGFTALVFDLAGSVGDRGNRTVYPDSVSYANYANCKDSLLTVNGSIKDTCWYEWGVAARYAFDYLASLPFVTGIGGIGTGEAATVLWHLAATEKRLKCAAFVKNCGWLAYSGRFKFSGIPDADFNDETLKFVAGVEPQTYAAHITCPTMLLVPTNCKRFDADRACDTLSRIKDGIYCFLDYSVKFRDSVSHDELKNCELFFDKFLCGKSVDLPSKAEIYGEAENGKLKISVSPDEKELAGVSVYVAEGVVDPALRSWREIKEYSVTDDGKYVFCYAPYSGSGIVTFFARMRYKNGATVGTPVLCKKFSESEASLKYKSNVIYSSRECETEGVFGADTSGVPAPIDIDLFPDNVVAVGEGPCGIKGVRCTGGLLTFAVGAERYRPSEEASILLDAYVKEDSVLSASVYTDFFGNRVEYVARLKLRGGNIWHNVKFSRTDFKTAEGRPLKNFDSIQGLKIDAVGEYLINNVLWV